MARRYPCPQCAREMLLERVHEGFEVPCPACGHRFLVPIGLVGDAPPPPLSIQPAGATAAPYSMPQTTPGYIPEPAGATGGVIEDGQTAMIVGILGLVVCQLLAPFAWVMGHRIRADARRAGREPPGMATAGWVMGIVGTVGTLVCGCGYGLILAVAASQN